MINTYRLMTKILVPENKKFTNEELAIMYQERTNASILAEIFCRNFSQWLFMVNKANFRNLDMADKVSIVLDRLDKALKSYDISKGFKFTTWGNKLILMELTNKNNYFKHALRSETVLVSINGASSPNEDLDINEINENKASLIVDSTIENEFNTIDLKVTINNSKLSDKEKLICNIIIDNPGITDLEISEMMKVHRHTVRNLKLGLRNKLAFIL